MLSSCASASLRMSSSTPSMPPWGLMLRLLRRSAPRPRPSLAIGPVGMRTKKRRKRNNLRPLVVVASVAPLMRLLLARQPAVSSVGARTVPARPASSVRLACASLALCLTLASAQPRSWRPTLVRRKDLRRVTMMRMARTTAVTRRSGWGSCALRLLLAIGPAVPSPWFSPLFFLPL